MKKKKNRCDTLFGLVFVIIMVVCEMTPGLDSAFAGICAAFLVVLGLGWLFTRKPGRARAGNRSGGRARRGFLPGRIGRQAGQAFYDGAMDRLTPKEPTPDEKLWQERQKAKKDYAFYSAQAKKYKGTGDGAWHEQRAKEAWNKMKR